MGVRFARSGVPSQGTLLDVAYFENNYTIPSTAVSPTTSDPFPGLSLQWVHGSEPVAVILRGAWSVTEVNAAAGVRVQPAAYIYDLGVGAANFPARNTWAIGAPKTIIFDLTANQQYIGGFEARDLVFATAGTEQTMQARAYMAAAGGATWVAAAQGLSLSVVTFEAWALRSAA